MASLIDPSKFNPRSILIKPNVAVPGKRPKVEYLFKVNGQSFIGRKQVQSLSGKTGHGKSTFGLCLMVACACGKFGPIETSTGKPIKALWIDTEQGVDLLTMRYEQVLRMAAIDHLPFKAIYLKRLRAISVSEFCSIREMKNDIEEHVNTMQPDFIFLDGVADLVEDINCIPEAKKILIWLEHLAADNNCAIMCVTHQNKNASNARGDKLGGIQGNVGSFLAKKAFDSFVVEKTANSGELRTVLHEKTRTYKQLDPLYMTATMEGEILEITLMTEEPYTRQLDKMEQGDKEKAIIIKAINAVEKPQVTDIVAYIHKNFKYSKDKARALVTHASSKEINWIKKEGKFYRAVEEPEEEQEDKL